MEPIKELAVNLKPFNPSSGIDVLEFLTLFEKKFKGRGESSQKAEILWGTFLPTNIQNATTDIAEDYNKLKKHLTHHYGDIHIVTGVLLRDIEKAKIPEMSDHQGRYDHLSKLSKAMKKIEDLTKNSNISKAAWDNAVLNPYFMARLTKLLHPELDEKFSDQISAKGLNIQCLQ